MQKINFNKIFIIIGIISILFIILYLLFKKKRTVLTIEPNEETEITISDEKVTFYVSELIRVISASFFTPVAYREVYNPVNQTSDYDLKRITNEYNLTTNSNLKTDISSESYWIFSEDLSSANRLINRLSKLGY